MKKLIFLVILMVGLLIIPSVMAETSITKLVNKTCVSNTTLQETYNITIDDDSTISNNIQTANFICQNGCTDDYCNASGLFTIIALLCGIILIAIVLLVIFRNL